MPVVGLAEVLLQPVFTGSQRTIAKEIGPAAERAGKSAGAEMGKGMADGLKSETRAMEAEVTRLGKAVGAAQDRVTTAKDRTAKAAEAESKALGALRVAELKLNEIRDAGNAKASALAAAEERVAAARNRASSATSARERGERNLAAATTDLNKVQRESATASDNLSKALNQSTADMDRAGKSASRFGALLGKAFPNRPMGTMRRSIEVDTKAVNGAMDNMIKNVQAQGTRGGRAFTQAFIGVSVGLTAVIPAAGAAGASLIAATGAVVTLASSLQQLAGVAALAPAGLIAIGAGAGVLKTAFSGMGEALTTAIEATDKITQAAGNPRLLAMAIEDANMAIVVAEENAAQAAEDASRRVSDAKRALQDTVEAVAEARIRAARAVEDAEKREADAAKEVKEAQKALAEARKGGDTDDILKAEEDLVSAQEAHTGAVQDRKDAVAAAAKQERDGQRAIQDAQRAIADATKAAERAQVDAARAVEQAHRNLERVQLQQADQASKAGEESALAMSKLTPAAQVAAKALLSVYDRLKGIRDIAQENFFTGFSGPLLALSDTVMPQLETGVGAISTALGGMAQQLMTSLDSALGEGVLETLLFGVADSITAMTGAVDPLVQAFVTLGTVGMPYMVALSEAIAKGAEDFNTWIQGAAESGELNTWIENGIQGFKDLFSIVGSVFGILGALGDAARAGGIDATIGGLADALNRVQTVMEGPVFQNTMATIFSGAAAGAEGLLAALGPIGEAFRTGADNFARFLELGGQIAGLAIGGIFTALSDPTFGAGLTTFLEAVKRGVEDMVPMLPGLTEAFGKVLEAIAPIAENLGPTLVEVFTGFATVIADTITYLSPLLEMLAGSPVVIGFLIAGFTATAAAAAGLTLAANLTRIAMAGVWLVTKGGPKILGAAAGAMRGLNAAMKANPVGFIVAAITAIITALVWFFTETELGRQIVQNVWNWIKGAIRNVADWFTGTLVPGFNKALKILGMFFKDLYNKYVKPVVDWVRGAWEDIMDYFTKDVPIAMAKFITGVTREWEKLKAAAKEPIRFVVNKVINEGLIRNFNKIPGVNIKELKLPKGFRKGGYTGDIPEDAAAGIVHGREFVFDAKATAAAGPKRLAALAARLRGESHAEAAASTCNHAANVMQIDNGPTRTPAARPTNSGFFMGNVNQIKPHGAYYMQAASGLAPWNFGGAAKLWDGAAGLKVRMGRGQHQGYLSERERGGGILGYTTGTNIDMSPSWKAILGPKQRLTVAAHEVGHAIGLPHDTGGASIMAPNLQNMAATPTRRDINNLQYLYPGGSGKAGQATPDNPVAGIVSGLIKEFKRAFPGAGMFVDAGIGLIQNGFKQVQKWIEDIKNGIKKIASDVVNNVKNFFSGGGAQAPDDYLLRDTGGILPPGFSQVLNRTGQNEFVVNNRQMRNIGELAQYRAQAGGDVWNVELPPRSTVDDLMNAVSFQQRRNRRGGRAKV